MAPRKVILRNFQSPGDIVMLTGAVRDLHRTNPGAFVTDVRTPCPELWQYNPFITPLNEADPDVTIIDCDYPLIHESNELPYHFIHAFPHFISNKLNTQIHVSAFRGDIYIDEIEKQWFSQVHEITGEDTPFWIIVGGGKMDYTIKWWASERWQRVVDALRGQVVFVQVGEAGHHHPPLDGVIDLRGKTDLRQLVRLVYNAQGIVCPVTSLMHLAAAIEVKGGQPKNRPCVVVAGGREPAQWEAYPHHQYIHTNGQLLCCDNGGCWKSRVVPLNDGDEKDLPQNLCVNVVRECGNSDNLSPSIERTELLVGAKVAHGKALPKCMELIQSEDVVRRILGYFEGGAIKQLTARQWERAKGAFITASCC